MGQSRSRGHLAARSISHSPCLISSDPNIPSFIYPIYPHPMKGQEWECTFVTVTCRMLVQETSICFVNSISWTGTCVESNTADNSVSNSRSICVRRWHLNTATVCEIRNVCYLDCWLTVINLSPSVAEKGAEGCKDLMEAFAACVKSAAEGTSWGAALQPQM